MSRKEAPRAGLVKAALAGGITSRQGAAALELSRRQFQRLKKRFQGEGAAGLVHRARGRPSRRRLPADARAQIADLLQRTYVGFNDCHFTDKLRELPDAHVHVSRSTVRRIRRALGLAAKHRRRPPGGRQRRTPEAAMGALIQVDGSIFDWLEARGPRLTLLGAIDDATGTVLALTFRPTEDLHGYAVLLQTVFTHYGLPVAIYGDGVSILVRTDRHWTLDEQLAGARTPTHLGRALQDLAIGYIQARSPQAKGRIERLWGTLQDRLVSELRLRAIATLDAANAFLPEFIASFNRRFAHAAHQPVPVWRRPPPDLDLVLSCRYSRVVGHDHTVRIGTRRVQLPRRILGRSYAGYRVDVRELLSGELVVLYHDAPLARQAWFGPFTLKPRAAPSDARLPAQPPRPPRSRPAPSPPPTPMPAARHPWRRIPFSPQERQRQASLGL